MRFISLFAGIGGFDLGLECAGMECVAQVEIDDFCQRVLQKHWPNVPKFKDVRDVGKHNLPAADLICGGFPCQDVSLAGKRKGLEGKRSTLWSEFYRIICEIRPQWVVVENVPGLLSANNGEFFTKILRELSEGGYDAEWNIVSAYGVGAPHLRERVFVVAYPKGSYAGQSVIGEKGAERENLSGERRELRIEPVELCETVPNSNGSRLPLTTRTKFGSVQEQNEKSAWGSFSGRSSTPQQWDWWAVEPAVGRVANGVPNRVDRIRSLGNAVVPQVAEFIGRCILQIE